MDARNSDSDVERLLAEVVSPDFAVTFRGYDASQVEGLLAKVATALRAVLRGTERTSVRPVERAAGDEFSRTTLLSELLTGVADEVERFRRDAETSAAEMLAGAERRAAAVLSDAERRAAEVMAAAEEKAAGLLAQPRELMAAAERQAAEILVVSRAEAADMLHVARSEAAEIPEHARAEATTITEAARQAEAPMAEDFVAASDLVADASREAHGLMPVSLEVDQGHRDPADFEQPK